MKQAVFLERDGVINRAIVRDGKPYPPKDIDSLEILPGVLKALNTLHKRGFLLIVVTNQPDVARGVTSKFLVEEIHSYLSDSLPIDEFRTCYHDDNDHCACRKPLPGLLLEAAKEHQIDLKNSYMVGDRWRDIEAGKNAGCMTIFLDYNYNEKQPESVDVRTRSLGSAVQAIKEKQNETL